MPGSPRSAVATALVGRRRRARGRRARADAAAGALSTGSAHPRRLLADPHRRLIGAERRRGVRSRRSSGAHRRLTGRRRGSLGLGNRRARPARRRLDRRAAGLAAGVLAGWGRASRGSTCGGRLATASRRRSSTGERVGGPRRPRSERGAISSWRDRARSRRGLGLEARRRPRGAPAVGIGGAPRPGDCALGFPVHDQVAVLDHDRWSGPPRLRLGLAVDGLLADHERWSGVHGSDWTARNHRSVRASAAAPRSRERDRLGARRHPSAGVARRSGRSAGRRGGGLDAGEARRRVSRSSLPRARGIRIVTGRAPRRAAPRRSRGEDLGLGRGDSAGSLSDGGSGWAGGGSGARGSASGTSDAGACPRHVGRRRRRDVGGRRIALDGVAGAGRRPSSSSPRGSVAGTDGTAKMRGPAAANGGSGRLRRARSRAQCPPPAPAGSRDRSGHRRPARRSAPTTRGGVPGLIRRRRVGLLVVPVGILCGVGRIRGEIGQRLGLGLRLVLELLFGPEKLVEDAPADPGPRQQRDESAEQRDLRERARMRRLARGAPALAGRVVNVRAMVHRAAL